MNRIFFDQIKVLIFIKSLLFHMYHRYMCVRKDILQYIILNVMGCQLMLLSRIETCKDARVIARYS